MKTLPHDWLAQTEEHVCGNDDGSIFEIPKEIDGKPNVPVYVDKFVKDGDWVVGIKCIKSSDFLREYNINDGDIIGFSINYKIFC